MLFFVGQHVVSNVHRHYRCFVSVNRLWKRKRPFRANDWILDSGAFSILNKHGAYPQEYSADNYSAQITKWKQCGNLLRAVSQDWMCEPFCIEKTGLSVPEHQRKTIDRYARLYSAHGDLIMPVVQGWMVDDYARHVDMYADALPINSWAGVGSICKREHVSEIAAILERIKALRPDLKLHGFGLKITALRCAYICDLLYSADSMSWSFNARMNGRNGNDYKEAQRFAAKIETMPRQERLI